jgi:hypothetical protein
MIKISTETKMQVLLDTNLVNATIQGDKKVIERVISMGASISRRHRQENELNDAIYTSMYFDDMEMLDFLFKTYQKYHTDFSITEQSIYDYLTLHFEKDNIKVLEIFKNYQLLEKVYKKRNDLFNENYPYCPNSFFFMLKEKNDLLESVNCFNELARHVGISLELDNHTCSQTMKEILKIILNEKPQYFNELIVCGLEAMSRVFDDKYTNEEMLKYLIDLGFDLQTPLKNLAPDNHSHFMTNYEDNSILDLIQNIEIKSRIEKKIFEHRMENKPLTTKKLKV